MSEAVRPRIGTVLGDRYRLRERLGAGGMAEVFLAHDVELDREVAVKVLEGNRGRHPVWRARFLREGRAMARVQHPNLVRIWEAGWDGDLGFLAMEVVAGRDSAQALRGRPADPARATRWAIQVGEALSALHAAGIWHRDLKASNVMIRDHDDSAVLMDLGLADEVDRTTITKGDHLLGTPAYFPPELLEEQGFTAASDQYQLGALLFQWWTARLLLPGHTLNEWLANLGAGVRNSFEPNCTVPWALRRVHLRATSARPEDRYPDTRAFVDALDTALQAPDDGAEAPTITRELETTSPNRGGASPDPSAGAPTRARTILRSGVALALLLVGLGFGRMIIARRPASRRAPPPSDLPAALAEVARLTPNHTLEVVTRRPCRLLEPGPPRDLGLGAHRLSIPADLPDPVVLRWRETGDERRRELPLVGLHRHLADRLLELAPADPLAPLEPAAFAGVRSWLSELLRGPLPRPTRARAFTLWQSTQLEGFGAWLRGEAAAWPRLPGPGAGALRGDPAPTPGERVLEQVDRRPGFNWLAETDEMLISTRFTTRFFAEEVGSAAQSLTLRLPPDLPRDRRPVELRAQYEGHVPPSVYLTLQGQGDSPPLRMWFPDPDPRERETARLDLHQVALVVPADLLPEPGSTLEIRPGVLAGGISTKILRLKFLQMHWE